MKDNQMTQFKYLETDVRTTVIDNEPYFVLKDLAKAFGLNDRQYKYESAQLQSYVAKVKAIVESASEGGTQKCTAFDEGRFIKKVTVQTAGGPQQMTAVNEPCMYYLSMRGNTTECILFSYWIYTDVLPKLRSQGYYISEQLTTQQFEALVRDIADKKQQIEALEAQNESLKIDLDKSLEYMTVGQYCKHISMQTTRGQLIRLGRQCSVYSAACGYEVKKCYGSEYVFNSYHINVLEAVVGKTAQESEYTDDLMLM